MVWTDRNRTVLTVTRRDKSPEDRLLCSLSLGLVIIYIHIYGKRGGEYAVNKPWGMVQIAAAFEVGWVIGLKHANNLWEWSATAIAIIISIYLMIKVSRYLPVGTVYALFVGLGTAGTVLAEILFLEQRYMARK